VKVEAKFEANLEAKFEVKLEAKLEAKFQKLNPYQADILLFFAVNRAKFFIQLVKMSKIFNLKFVLRFLLRNCGINQQARIWSRNPHGRVYKKGVGEEGLWCIVELSEGGNLFTLTHYTSFPVLFTHIYKKIHTHHPNQFP
jgi:hypothetical protein